MSSTYSNLGIELIGTGEQAGTWGITTNSNFSSIIDNAIVGYVKVTLTTAGTSGSPNTLNVASGSASDGQKRIVEVYSASDLGATCFLQITPATFAGYYIIRNSLAGSRSVRIFQGSYVAGNSVLLVSGYDAIIRCDGAGTPKVTNILNNIQGTSFSGLAATATTATNATNAAITNDNATAVAVYPTWVTANTGNLPLYATSAKLSFVPSTGVLTAFGGFNGTATAATALTVANDISTSSTVYPTWATTDVGNVPQYVSTTALTFVPSTGVLTATAFSGDGSSLVNVNATNAVNTTYTTITDNTSSSSTVYLTWVSANTGNLPQTVSSTKLTFVPSTGILTATGFAGAINGTVGATTPASGAFTTLSATALTLSAPKTITLSTYTVTTTDVSLRFSTSNCTVTLPAAASYTGRILYLNTITAHSVISASSDVIPLGSSAAGTAILAATAGKFAMLQSNGTYWITMMAN